MNNSARDWVISWPNLEGLISEGNSFRMLIAGGQNAWISFDATRTELAVEIEQQSAALPAVLPQAISMRLTKDAKGSDLLVIATASVELRRYFYDFAVEVLDLTQRGGRTAQAAVDEAWKRWGELIEQQSVLSRERQVGLIGELQLLRLLAAAHGWSFAIDAWHRTARAEHDFSLEICDIEVKTTTSDRRVHTIGSIDQLLSSPNRPLYILSNQFAVAPKLAVKSFSLASTVRDSFKELERDVSLQSALQQRLVQVGWRENHMSYYQTTFVVRDLARLVPVDDACPRIVPQMLINSLGSVSNRIESVMYSIDVSDLGWQEGSQEYKQVLP
jgi:hypothetical protein